MTTDGAARRSALIQGLLAMAVTWLPLLVLTALSGHAFGDSATRPFLTDLSVLMRFLIALPLLAYGGDAIRMRLHWVTEFFQNSDMLQDLDQTRFREAADRQGRWYGARSARIGSAVLGLGASWLTLDAAIGDIAVSWISDGSGLYSGLSIAGWWFFAVSLSLWHYFALMRLWQFVNWWAFLARLSRLELQLVPTHPDRCGGIGILEMGQLSFSVVVAGFAAILAASIAESLIAGTLLLPAAIPYILVFALASIAVLVTPLLGFVPMLVRTKRAGLVTYGDIGEGLFRAFDQKWAGLTTKQQQALLGSVDPSSLADYGYCYEVVDEMRYIPLSRDGFVTIGLAVVLPFLPLILIHHSAVEILQRLLGLGG